MRPVACNITGNILQVDPTVIDENRQAAHATEPMGFMNMQGVAIDSHACKELLSVGESV
ncbi:hypothetical protein [Erwinia amylovora]|uniref:hypothetical protein n=1 Tax=Erwinia amylovora TaxID=552 RepID=UPI001950B64B